MVYYGDEVLCVGTVKFMQLLVYVRSTSAGVDYLILETLAGLGLVGG